ncbi:MAG: flavin reductase family protein [Deltaproteobacteria bacterium]|jgi:flavin reductase (DIM6/NTAB) family NADH-FMN oxidoreductase RutF|nr:flavin reductase family protein [Deltaproteobacteria bacterium]
MKKSHGPKTLAYPLPAWLVGTYDENGAPNIMTAAWAGILASDPPVIGVSIRPSRATFDGITLHKAFTVSCPSAALAVETDFAGIVSGRMHDKFREAGLTPAKATLVNAPYVEECPVVAECRLLKTLELGSHVLFAGQILDVKAEEGVESENGSLDVPRIDPLVYSSAGYFRLGEFLGPAFSIGKKLVKAVPQPEQ